MASRRESRGEQAGEQGEQQALRVVRGVLSAYSRRINPRIEGSAVAIARHDEKTLPPLVQRLCNDEVRRRLFMRTFWMCAIPTLAPMLVLGVGALLFFDALMDAHSSGAQLWGWPIVAMGEGARGWIAMGDQAVGVVAIGPRVLGVVALGTMAIGVFSCGSLGIGVFSLGAVGVGLWAFGAIALGWVASGAFALGRLAAGAFAVGWYAVGAHAVGAYAWGEAASRGFFRAESREAIPPPRPVAEREQLLFPNWRRSNPSGSA